MRGGGVTCCVVTLNGGFRKAKLKLMKSASRRTKNPHPHSIATPAKASRARPETTKTALFDGNVTSVLSNKPYSNQASHFPVTNRPAPPRPPAQPTRNKYQSEDEYFHVRRGREASGRFLSLCAGISKAAQLEPPWSQVRLFQGLLLRGEERAGGHGEGSRGEEAHI